MIYLVDYPQSKDEVYALARHGYSLNGLFEINEVPKADAEEADEESSAGAGSDEDDDDEDGSGKSKKGDANAEEAKKEVTPDSQETQSKMQEVIDGF